MEWQAATFTRVQYSMNKQICYSIFRWLYIIRYDNYDNMVLLHGPARVDIQDAAKKRVTGHFESVSNISQGKVASLLTCSGIFIVNYCKFTAESRNEIGWQLANLRARVHSGRVLTLRASDPFLRPFLGLCVFAKNTCYVSLRNSWKH